MPYLTPDDVPEGEIAVTLYLPQGVEWEGIARGALLSLLYPSAWELHGSVSVEDTIAAYEGPIIQTLGQWRERENGVVFPVGAVNAMAFQVEPDGWLKCDGRSLVRDEHPALFTAIGTSFGAVDSNHFSLPNLEGRTVIGEGDLGGGDVFSFADELGETRHMLTGSEEGEHRHQVKFSTVNVSTLGGATPVLNGAGTAVTINSQYVTQGSAHNNMQPSLVLNWFIYEGPLA